MGWNIWSRSFFLTYAFESLLISTIWIECWVIRNGVYGNRCLRYETCQNSGECVTVLIHRADGGNAAACPRHALVFGVESKCGSCVPEWNVWEMTGKLKDRPSDARYPHLQNDMAHRLSLYSSQQEWNSAGNVWGCSESESVFYEIKVVWQTLQWSSSRSVGPNHFMFMFIMFCL